MTPDELRTRTKSFALRVVKLYRSLPRTADAQVMGKQLLRCGTSVAANYRASCRARSRAEFAARIGVVVEEADESGFWLEMLAEAGIVRMALLKDCFKNRRN
jgi:four helix bundle protein